MRGSPTRKLPPYAELVSLRQGGKDRDPMTMAAIGDRYGTSRQAVERALRRGAMQQEAKEVIPDGDSRAHAD